MPAASTLDLPRYDLGQPYRWNYDHAPDPVSAEAPPVPGTWTFCGRPVPSPLGIPAGPLLNGRWCLYYASLGFDVLTYKTVRSGHRECYPLPNLVPVETLAMTGRETSVPAVDHSTGSWAVSFGMPSMTPDVWRHDVEATRRVLSPEKLLSVSVVGTVQPGWSLDDLAADYARCARWAVDAGADAIEANLSCPNVATCDGQLYQQPADARIVAQALRQAVGDTPLILKIGHVDTAADTDALLDAVAPSIDALAMTNSVATTIQAPDGSLLFDGQRRGICGAATFEASLRQTRLFADRIRARGDSVRLISVGGISTAGHVQSCLAAGAESAHIATAAMQDPAIALTIRQHLGTPR